MHTLGLMCTHGHPQISSHASSQNNFGHFAVHISHADVLTRYLTWLLFLRSRHSSHILVCGKCRNWWRHNFRCVAEQSIHGQLPQEDLKTITLETQSYGVDVLCGFTDSEHEIKKPKHVCIDDDSEPVQMTETETRKVIAMMLVILEQMTRKFVRSRRMKDLR